jgi:hypothetical protein
LSDLAEEPTEKEHRTDQDRHSHHDIQAEVGGVAARLAQAIGAGVFRAIVGLAIPAYGPCQALAFIAGGGLIFLRLLQAPPSTARRLAEGPVAYSGITRDESAATTRTTIVLVMLGADELTARLTARNGIGLAKVTGHIGPWFYQPDAQAR